MQIKLPKLCHHKHQELGYIWVKGKPVYFKGKWPREQKTPPEDVQRQYKKACAELMKARSAEPVKVDNSPTVAELYLAFYHWARSYYVKKGKPTTEPGSIKDACRIAARMFGRTKARDFGTKALLAVRQAMIDKGWERNHINKQIDRIRRMFRWAVEQELLDDVVWLRLKSVKRLPKGRGIPEERDIPPVPDDVFEATARHLPGTLAHLARVHRLIGCRADEACAMRVCELEQRPGKAWIFRPEGSKNAAKHYVGPRARAILGPLIEGLGDEEFIFKTRKRGAGHWSTASYRRAVTRICKQHKIPRWSPLMVRKAAAQEVRDQHPRGIEATQARLDHEDISVSQLYAWQKDKLAEEVAEQFG